MASILPNTDSLHLGRSYTACLCLISGGFLGAAYSTASAAGAELVRRAHHLLNSFYKFPANLLLRWPWHNSCCSGGHARLLLLRRPLHNNCFSGARCITAAPVAIALASSFSSIFDSTTNIAFSSLDAAAPTSRSWLGGRYSFLW